MHNTMDKEDKPASKRVFALWCAAACVSKLKISAIEMDIYSTQSDQKERLIECKFAEILTRKEQW